MSNWTRWALALCCAAGWLASGCGDDSDDNSSDSGQAADTAGTSPQDASQDTASNPGDDATQTAEDATDAPDAPDAPDTTDTSTGPQPVTATPPAGPLEGEASDGVRAFLGIPYAAPPTGDGRWRPAQPLAPWTTPRPAKAFGQVCVQESALGGSVTGDEDCLFLNVWTPDPAPANAPVMVWIHGGGFRSGAGSDTLYHGRRLASKGVVVVTLNYRLGPLGMLAHPALTAEGDGASGNYGLGDQQLALAWVRDNIAAFGGDPNNVTIFGESAGGFSACYHLVMPQSAGLFHKAILQSGPCAFNTPLDDLDGGEALGAEVAVAVGCADAADVAACLRAKPPADITAALPPRPGFFVGEGTEWRPILDGRLLTEPPAVTVAAGRAAQAPVMLGSNADEGTLFLAFSERAFTDADYTAWLTDTFGQDAPTVQAEYPAAAFASVNDAIANVIGDAVFVCGARASARALAAQGSPVFLYHFTHPFRFPLYDDLGAYHSADVPFVFQNPYITVRLTADERALSDVVQGYWTRFAATGDPGGDPSANAPAWPPYDATSDQHLIIDLSMETGSGLKRDRCDFWDTIWGAP